MSARRLTQDTRGARGFTLLEVAVAMALFGVVIGVAAGVMATVLAGNRRARVHSELQRDASFVSQLLNSELHQAGLGVPRSFNDQCVNDGFHIKRDCSSIVGGTCDSLYGQNAGTTTFARFNTSVVLADDTQVGIVADLPRPDGQYSAYGPLHNRAMGPLSRTSEFLVWHNENSGTCAPGNGCAVASESLFYAPEGVAGQVCSDANPNARTCPWGARRVLGGEAIQIVAGDSTWSTATVRNPLRVIDVGTLRNAAGVPPLVDTANRFALELSTGFDMNETIDPAAPIGTPGSFSEDGVWRNFRNGEGPGGINGQGWVVTLDRVFFHFVPSAKIIQRIQCFGDPDPANANWPPVGTGTVTDGTSWTNATFAYTPNGGSAVTCVGPEIVARNVDAVTFTYFNAAGTNLGATVTNEGACVIGSTPLTGKNAVRRIGYTIRFRAPVDAVATHDVQHTIQGSVRLQNL